ncbi:TonB-dependent receptor plug domain-containing protein [Flavobacterium sp. TP390]|uniref:TonB-dependent receptor plug domain-containing protein n=1 Tax=Flavobacterium profundi TaxID=1774945 RepID=A0A6I4IIV4_9FLAO|nr:TonB-dependent receptor [Flavobacterium profundi]MVO09660.1 TonB-dependent receptor plug domain-containing protein [Flavobacterium profundi]
MRVFKKLMMLGLFLLATQTIFSQSKITGTVIDGDFNGPLPGANVFVKGTKDGATTGFDGKFEFTTTMTSGEIVVSYLGFETVVIPFSGSSNLGNVSLKSNENQLESVVLIGKGVIDVAKDRKTPVAVSTIKATEIQEKLGNQEFPEMLVNTPSVYATKSGGGFGDSRINIRGFDQRNIAVMINGVPVNDMENGAVYWSNWAGLSDVTSAMQVQRGLGSSKLAISSVGGTINVITRTSEMKQGGVVSVGVANDDYLKTQASYSTGKMENGFSTSILLSRTQGNMFADGTKFEGHNYFIAFGYELNEKHNFQFTFTGAPQWHNQRSFANTIATYLQYGDPVNKIPNTRYNSDWGYLNGREYSWVRNFYHKPVASLNWDFTINDKMKLTTVLYGSWGRGGGTGNIGKSPFSYKTVDGLVPFDDFVAFNRGQYNPATGQSVTPITGAQVSQNANGDYQTSRSVGFTRRASINSHDWYGGVINLNTKLTDELTLDFGIDARTYKGYHFRNINDRLGADVYLDNRDINNPDRLLYETYEATPSWNPITNIKNQEKIEYNNNGYVRWYGAFTQLEYATDKLSAFIQGAVSQQGFSREDTFIYLESDPLYKTDFENILGGNIKGGANYNIDEKNNVFANAGYYSKQPFFNAVYRNNQSVVADDLTNEKILGIEAGYGFNSPYFNAKLNLYYTSWKDRYQRSSDSDSSNRGGYYDINKLNETHSGVELELNAKPINKLNINAMFSYGMWDYNGNAEFNRFDQNNTLLGNGDIYLDKVKVGDAAQMTASFGAGYEVLKGLKVDANYRFVDKLYASIDPARFLTEDNKGTLELPNYGLMDAGISYKMLVGKDKDKSVSLRFNMNNVLNEIYIAESRTNIFADDLVNSSNPAAGTYASNNRLYNGVADANQVFFGFGRTWNFTLRYQF